LQGIEIGIRPIMLPFNSTVPVMKAIVAGTLDYGCDPVLNPLPHVKAGTAKALAIATHKRSPLLPKVPTSFEQGMPEFDCAPFYAVFAPKGTPKEIVDKLAAALNKDLDEPTVQKRFADLGTDIAEPTRRDTQSRTSGGLPTPPVTLPNVPGGAPWWFSPTKSRPRTTNRHRVPPQY